MLWVHTRKRLPASVFSLVSRRVLSHPLPSSLPRLPSGACTASRAMPRRRRADPGPWGWLHLSRFLFRLAGRPSFSDSERDRYMSSEDFKMKEPKIFLSSI
ncbi:hypothetical protein BS78_08G118500 [Paspalum vaginatum]|nr:hypothetical protein BS78_08G118500 [Paspalum vaginatum]